jgi:hypothetical protein
MIQRPKNNPRTGDMVVPRVQRGSRHRRYQATCWCVFWDKDGILLTDCLGKGATFKEAYYIPLLNKLKKQLVSKRRSNISKGILFLQDNAAHHKTAITHQKLADLHFEVLKHLAYSSDFAPSDLNLFLNLTKHLKGRKYSSECFLDKLKKLEQRSHNKCVELRGYYV